MFFILLFALFNVFYAGGVDLWFPFLLDVFAFTFALLIILYLSSLFTWKTVGLFAGLLTALDVILVFSGPMVKAAETFSGAGLPVLLWLPIIPLIHAPANYPYTTIGGFEPIGLGLGDFFFAGILTIQTLKKFGKRTAYITAFVIAVAFGIWELFLPTIDNFFNIARISSHGMYNDRLVTCSCCCFILPETQTKE